MLNLIIFLLMFSFVMLPIIVVPRASGNITFNRNDGEGLVLNLLLTNRGFLNVTGAQGKNSLFKQPLAAFPSPLELRKT